MLILYAPKEAADLLRLQRQQIGIANGLEAKVVGFEGLNFLVERIVGGGKMCWQLVCHIHKKIVLQGMAQFPKHMRLHASLLGIFIDAAQIF